MRRDEVDPGDGLELAEALVQVQRDVRERLEPRAQPRLRLPDPLGDRADPPPLERVEVEDPVGLAEAERAEDDCLGPVAATGHGRLSLERRPGKIPATLCVESGND